MEDKRLFIAFPPTAEIIVAARELSGSGIIPGPVKWTPDANLHLTSVFIGSASLTAIARIKGIMMTTAMRSHPFMLDFRDTVWAPPEKPATMVWFRFGESSAFGILTRELEASLVSPGLGRIKRPPRRIPHITVARFKGMSGRQGVVGFDARIGTYPCAELVLYESVPAPNGPRYEPLERVRLGG